MENIASIIRKKPHDFHIVGPATSVSLALHQMASENTDYLVVMDENQHFMGILSEHDILSRAMNQKTPLETLNVRDVMGKDYPIVTLTDTIDKCMHLLRQHRTRVLAIFENFNFKGILSIDDILDAVLMRPSGDRLTVSPPHG